ncbi:MAG: hypothetical protein AAB592_02700 [Patescibacteria group bacterium]
MDFLKDLELLRYQSPRIALVNIDAENSEYASYCYKNKECYLIYASDYNRDCINCYFIYHCEDCTDSSYCQGSTLCYNCVDMEGCYDCLHSQDCRNCTEVEYSYDMVGCMSCFGCVGLRQKQFHVFNEKVTQEEYKKRLPELRKMTAEEIMKRVNELRARTPILYMHQLQNENCLGDYVFNSKNCFACFDINKCEDCMYMNNTIECRDCMDCSNFYFDNELSYECVAGTYCYNCNFCYSVFESQNMEYCEQCYNSSDCFGCIGLKRKQYYILNKPHSKEDYFKKKAEIIAALQQEGLYGEALPSTYPYADSLAATFWPAPAVG